MLSWVHPDIEGWQLWGYGGTSWQAVPLLELSIWLMFLVYLLLFHASRSTFVQLEGWSGRIQGRWDRSRSDRTRSSKCSSQSGIWIHFSLPRNEIFDRDGVPPVHSIRRALDDFILKEKEGSRAQFMISFYDSHDYIPSCTPNISKHLSTALLAKCVYM